MDASLAAFVLAAADLALLGLLAQAWCRDRRSRRVDETLRGGEFRRRVDVCSKEVRAMCRELEAQTREAETLKGRFDAFERDLSMEAGSLQEQVDALRGFAEERVQTLGDKLEEFKGRTLGWQEGFSTTMREQVQRMEEQVAELLEPDEDGQFGNSRWIEELKSVKAGLSALEKRMAEAEKGWPVFIRDRTQEPVHPAPPQWSCRQPPVVWRGKPAPEAGETEPLHQPFKITCQAKDEACE